MSTKTPKIALIGGGNIGGTLAHLISIKNLADIVLFDIKEGVPQGKSLDITQSAVIEGIDIKLQGTNNYEDLIDSDVIIVTAGLARQPGMTSRSDLLSMNSEVIKLVAHNIKLYAKDAFVIVITNPLDVMTYLLYKESGLAPNKIVGMGGVLDSARFSLFLAEEFNISVEDVSSFVIGGHSDTMLPLSRYSTVKGIPIPDLVKMGWTSADRIEEIVQRTQKAGPEVTALLKTSSAYYAPAVSAIKIAESYIYNKRNILPCSVYLNGEYGIKDLFVGVPVIIGCNGIEKIIELDLTSNERDKLQHSVNEIKALVNLLPNKNANSV